MVESFPTDPSEKETKLVPVSWTMSQEAYDEWKTLADARGQTEIQVLRDALSTQKFLDEFRDKGGHVVLARADGTVVEVLGFQNKYVK